MSCRDLGQGSDLPSDTELNIYKFYSRGGVESANLVTHVLSHGLFFPDQLGTLKLTTKSGGAESVLSRLEEFSVRNRGRGKKGPVDSDRLRKDYLQRIHPDQVVFFEMTRPKERSDVLGDSLYPPEVLSDRPDFSGEDRIHIRESGLWVVSGQYVHSGVDALFKKGQVTLGDFRVPFWRKNDVQQAFREDDPGLIELRIQQLPWQFFAWKEKRYGDLIPPALLNPAVNPSRYPVVFEVGRLAQEEQGFTEGLYQAAVTHIYDQVVHALQAKVEDAFVFSRVHDEGNKKRLVKIGFTEAEDSPFIGGHLMVVPLVDLVEKFGLGGGGRLIQNLHSFYRGDSNRFVWQGFANLRFNHKVTLDFFSPSLGWVQKEPLVVTDLSTNFQLHIQETALHFQLSSEDRFDELFRVLQDGILQRYSDFSPWKLSDNVPLRPEYRHLKNQNGIFVTNLDGELAESHPEYLPLLLLSLNRYIMEQHQPDIFDYDIETATDQMNLNFAIRTFDHRIFRQAKDLGMIDLWGGQSEAGGRSKTFMISRAKVVEMGRQYPFLNNLAAREGIGRGPWFFRTLAADPVRY